MNKTFKLSQRKFSKNVIVITSLTAFFCISLILLFKPYKEFVYCFSMLGFLTAILFLFYRVRYNPLFIIVSDDNISIDYLNKSFFRRKPFKSNNKDLHLEVKKNTMILYKQEQIIAKIDKNAFEEKDKEVFLDCIGGR